MTYNVLQSKYSKVINDCVAAIKRIELCRVFVFGSYAKGCVKPTSDIDLLILLSQPLTFKERMDYISRFEESIFEKCGTLNLDLKVMNEQDFYGRIETNNSFENIISSYMVEVI